jgi:hypothetical protein
VRNTEPVQSICLRFEWNVDPSMVLFGGE